MKKYKLLELRASPLDEIESNIKKINQEDSDDDKPVTKKDFKHLRESLMWPPEFTRNQDLLRAEEMVQRRDEILSNTSLSSSEKLRRLSEVDRSFILFSKKAADALGSNYTVPKPISASSNTMPSVRRSPGTPMSINQIIDLYTKNQKQKARETLTGLQRIGQLNWTDKGELYDVNSNTVMEGTDISTLAKYHTLTNKTNKPVPKGYSTYKNAVKIYKLHQKPDVASVDPTRKLKTAIPFSTKRKMSAKTVRGSKRKKKLEYKDYDISDEYSEDSDIDADNDTDYYEVDSDEENDDS